jgi:hypothetical protein
MSIKNNIAEALDQFIKYGAWIACVVVGLMGKFGLDLVTKKKITLLYVVGTTFLGGFAGFISSRWFIIHNQTEAGTYWVPIITLAAKDFVMFLTMIDWQKTLSALTKLDIKKKEN